MITYASTSVPSTFSVSNRPIYLFPLAEMTHKNKEVAWPIIAAGVMEIVHRHPQDRVLIHSVSYDLTSYLSRYLSSDSTVSTRILSYTQAKDRQRTLDMYLAQPAAILVAPSLDRGIDLAGDDCRAIVICKVPYPNLGDAQIKARTYAPGGQLWYSVQTVRTLVQMSGRGVRNKDDYCETYILDRQFISSIWKKSKSLLPGWWSEALVFDAGRLV